MMLDALQKLVYGIHLTDCEAQAAMNEIMEGNATHAQIGAFLAALRLKGETVHEVLGCARAMRAKMIEINTSFDTLVDTCGTGGDGSGTFNISTASAFVVAGAGIPVAKHGNRSVSSKCGSADVLEALGVDINMEPQKALNCLEEVGIVFLYAPLFHSAMKHAAAPRKELGVRTVFNVLGPLSNPARASSQVVGVYDENLTLPIAEVLCGLGVSHALVVHGLDGMDEISISAPSKISEVTRGDIKTYIVDPEEFGLRTAPHGAVKGGNADYNASVIISVLRGDSGPARDVVLLNAAAAFIASGSAADFPEGIELASRSIDSGAAMARLEALRGFSQQAARLRKGHCQ